MRISQKHRYLIAGAWNTAFGYSFGLAIYYLFEKIVTIYGILLISNIVSITMAFFTHKLFVFKTKGNWLKEYLKSYVVYGVSALIGAVSIWILVEYFSVKFWIAQGASILLCVIFSYFANSKYTYSLE
jgi:putative flippase GtrA